jgi:hypothetical protein
MSSKATKREMLLSLWGIITNRSLYSFGVICRSSAPRSQNGLCSFISERLSMFSLKYRLVMFKAKHLPINDHT